MENKELEKKRLISVSDASKYLGISKQTLNCWRYSGSNVIPFIKIGRLVKYRITDLDEFIRKNKYK